MSMQDLVKQAQKMQKDMAKVQEDLKERIVEGAAGGGMVKALVNGALEVVRVEMDKEVIDPDDAEMLEELTAAAVNAAIKKAEAMKEEAMKKVTGGLGLPGMM